MPPPVASALRGEIEAIEQPGYWTVQGAVIMPDHLHLLITLHDKLALSRVVARFKAKTKPVLAVNQLRWQGNYYEHRLRAAEVAETVLLYIYLNPYRANLIKITGGYRWFWLGQAEAAWFAPRLDHELPFPEWLR